MFTHQPTKQHENNISLGMYYSLGRAEGSVRIRDLCIRVVTWWSLYGEELLAPRPPPKLEDHPLSAVRDCLFNTKYHYGDKIKKTEMDVACSTYGSRVEVSAGF
jgi:hypothetical protein